MKRLRYPLIAVLLGGFIGVAPVTVSAEESHPGLEAEADYAEAVIYYNRRQYGDTLRVLDGLLQTSPGNVQALELKALTAKVQGNEEESLKSYKKLLALTTETSRGPYYFEIGAILHK